MHAGVDNKARPNHAVLYRTQGMMYLYCQYMIISEKDYHYASSKIGLSVYLCKCNGSDTSKLLMINCSA